MTIDETTAKVAELREELAKEKAVVAGGTRPENPGKIGNLRRTIARFLTITREKELKREKVATPTPAPKKAGEEKKESGKEHLKAEKKPPVKKKEEKRSKK